MCSRPDKMNPHQQGERHAQKNADQCQPQVVQPDHFVVGIPESAPQEAGSMRFRCRVAAIISDHGGRQYTSTSLSLEGARGTPRPQPFGKVRGMNGAAERTETATEAQPQ